MKPENYVGSNAMRIHLAASGVRAETEEWMKVMTPAWMASFRSIGIPRPPSIPRRLFETRAQRQSGRVRSTDRRQAIAQAQRSRVAPAVSGQPFETNSPATAPVHASSHGAAVTGGKASMFRGVGDSSNLLVTPPNQVDIAGHFTSRAVSASLR